LNQFLAFPTFGEPARHVATPLVGSLPKPGFKFGRSASPAVDKFLDTDIDNRVITFDGKAAYATASLIAERRRRGQPGDLRDGMIAGIALATGASLATRNTRHFDDLAI